uniref:Uncharacterized protein n=1 Tax=Rhizophora mucronata TaxID=61149 RepID=A0A2P2QZ96_RHIMU
MTTNFHQKCQGKLYCTTNSNAMRKKMGRGIFEIYFLLSKQSKMQWVY